MDMKGEKRQELLNDYAAASRALADAVEQMRDAGFGGEAFIHALEVAGTAHRTCERSRIRLEKHMALTLTREHL